MTTVCCICVFLWYTMTVVCVVSAPVGVFPLLALWVQGVLCGVCAFCWWRWLMLGVVSAFTVGVGFRVLGKWLASRLCLTFCVWCFTILYRQWLLLAWCLPVLLWRWLSFIRPPGILAYAGVLWLRCILLGWVGDDYLGAVSLSSRVRLFVALRI